MPPAPPPAECHIVFPKAGNPEGIVGQTPTSARVPRDPLFICRISFLRIPGRPARGPAADLGVCPTVCADVREWENYVALGFQPATKVKLSRIFAPCVLRVRLPTREAPQPIAGALVVPLRRGLEVTGARHQVPAHHIFVERDA